MIIPFLTAFPFAFAGTDQHVVSEGDETIELQIMRQELTSENINVTIETMDGTASSIGK